MTASSKSVAVSAIVNFPVWEAVRSVAKAEHRTISDLLRPLVRAAIERGEVMIASDEDVAGGMPIAVRLGEVDRKALRVMAAKRGVNVSRVLAGIIVQAYNPEGPPIG